MTENSTGLFTFQSADLADANFSGGRKVNYRYHGLLGGGTVFDTGLTGPLHPIQTFLTIASPSGAVIDELRISLTSSNTVLPFNVDNIQATTVPEPLTMAMVGLATWGLGGYVRKRIKAYPDRQT